MKMHFKYRLQNTGHSVQNPPEANVCFLNKAIPGFPLIDQHLFPLSQLNLEHARSYDLVGFKMPINPVKIRVKVPIQMTFMINQNI